MILQLSDDDENNNDGENNVVNGVPLVLPVRQRRPPDRYGEWVTIVDENHAEPKNFGDALADRNVDKWKRAMQEEIDSLNEYDVWELTKLPEGRKAVGCKWVYKIKRNSNGDAERFKARLVAQGYAQKYGEDYDETFSPVVRFESIRSVIALSVQRKLQLHQMDITAAFLNGELNEDVYMKQPQGFEDNNRKDYVYKLKKSLYGLKQSSRCWNSVLHEHLKSMGFCQTAGDPCIYIRDDNGEIFIIAVHVDDLIMAGSTKEKIAEVKNKIASRFKAKDMGPLSYILGLQVIQKNGSIWLGQTTYTKTILNKFGMENCKQVGTPVESCSKLMKCTEDSEMFDKHKYQSAIGSLLYLSFGYTL